MFSITLLWNDYHYHYFMITPLLLPLPLLHNYTIIITIIITYSITHNLYYLGYYFNDKKKAHGHLLTLASAYNTSQFNEFNNYPQYSSTVLL